MAQKTIVRLAANFERNLESTAAFLAEANAQHACDALLDALLDTVVPNLERFPDIGRLFMERPARSVEVLTAVAGLRAKLGDGELREYLLSDYQILYARYDETVTLLSIKHHRQLSFDFDRLWAASQSMAKSPGK